MKEPFLLQPYVRGLPRVQLSSLDTVTAATPSWEGMGCCAGGKSCLAPKPLSCSMYKPNNITLTPTFTCRNRKTHPTRQGNCLPSAWGYNTTFLLFTDALRMHQMDWECFAPAAFFVVWTFPFIVCFISTKSLSFDLNHLLATQFKR